MQARRIALGGRSVVAPASRCAYSKGHGMLRSRVVVATFLVLTCAACSDDGASTAPPTTASPTLSAPSTAAPSVPPELEGYGPDERAAYQAAVTAYASYIKRNDAIYAAGKTTVGAKNFFQKYAIDWSTAWGNLAEIVNNHATVSGETKTVWTKPKTIKLNASSGDVVVLRVCVDASSTVVTQYGKRLPQPQLRHPRVQTVRLERRPAEMWWRSGIAKQGKTC